MDGELIGINTAIATGGYEKEIGELDSLFLQAWQIELCRT